MQDEMMTMDSGMLREWADELKQDAKDLFGHGHKDEAMKLFRLFKRITAELHRRRNPTVAAQFN